MFEAFDREDEDLVAFWIKTTGDGVRALTTKDKMAILKLAVNRQWPIVIKELLIDSAAAAGMNKNEAADYYGDGFETRLLEAMREGTSAGDELVQLLTDNLKAEDVNARLVENSMGKLALHLAVNLKRTDLDPADD